MSYLHVHPEVAAALAEGRPVVALESTIISHGLPRPDNLRIAREIEQRVRDAGAVPATIAVVAGRVRIGLDDAGLETVATELLADRAWRALPLTDVGARDLVRSVRAAPLLFGHAGSRPVDVAALEELVLRVCRLAPTRAGAAGHRGGHPSGHAGAAVGAGAVRGQPAAAGGVGDDEAVTGRAWGQVRPVTGQRVISTSRCRG